MRAGSKARVRNRRPPGGRKLSPASEDVALTGSADAAGGREEHVRRVLEAVPARRERIEGEASWKLHTQDDGASTSPFSCNMAGVALKGSSGLRIDQHSPQVMRPGLRICASPIGAGCACGSVQVWCFAAYLRISESRGLRKDLRIEL